MQQLAEMSMKREKYLKSGLNSDTANRIKTKLLNVMEREAPYTDSTLTLNSLARILEVSPHNLSEVINLHLKQNFFDFINNYRLQKVKKDLSDPQKSNLTFLAIAFEAGFNSKSSFNLIFKKHTGLTPSQYKSSLIPRD
jgi:AraC-like DNA-binding protein